MNNLLYFDRKDLPQRNFFILKSEIETEQGYSYDLEDWIGRGGNAAVFRGRQRATDEKCAIKFLMNTSRRNSERFRREVELLKVMQGDHITSYYGTGHVTVRHNRRNKSSRDKKLPFIVMELADCNLQDVMCKKRALGYERYAGQFRGLAGALADLHEHAVHRDIKPENILIVGERWLLSDYGLCTFVNPGEEDLTSEGENVGPKFWLSPEAHNRRLGRGDEINKASDVFQLAAIFWYVATGRHPSGILTKCDWTGPEKLFRLLHRSLFHDGTKRPQDGHEFFTDLEEALSQ